MTPTPEVQARLRRYLLGQLSDDASEAVERDLLVKDELFEELLVIEDEVIDDYLRGQLSDAERMRFEQHFLATSERREKLKFGRAFNRYLSPQSSAFATDRKAKTVGTWEGWARPFFSSPVRVAVLAIIVVGVLFGVWRFFLRQSEVDKGLLALNSAYREQRPIEARISSLSYAPFSQTRGGVDRVDVLARNRAEAILSNAVNEERSAAAHHALGEAYLAKKQFDDAINEFDEALKTDPKNAQLYSDLGAAWLEKGKANRNGTQPGQEVQDFARSLDKVNRALELNPSLLEALFNRAILHQEMKLSEQAEKDWKEYLTKDSTSKWANEASQNLKLLDDAKRKTSKTRAELLRDFLTAYGARDDERAWQVVRISREALSRKLIWEQLLDRYFDASAAKNESEIEDSLTALAYEGELEKERARDQYVADLSRFYKVAGQSHREELAQARGLMKTGHDHYFKNEMEQAASAYERARAIFAVAGDHCEVQYAQHWTAYSYYEMGKTQQGLSMLEELMDSLEHEKYEWLLMRTLHIASSAHHNLDEYSKAINCNRRALTLAEGIDDSIGIFNASSILIFQYDSMGNHPQALEYVQRSLEVVDACPLNEIQLARHYSIIALAFDSAGLYDAAIDYQKEALRRALAIDHRQHASVDYARLGVMYAKKGRLDEAFENLSLAYKTGASCPDEATRKEMMGYASLQTGHLYRERGDLAKAIDNYSQTIAVGDNLRFQYDVYEAHKNRLFCYLALHDPRSGDELNTTLNLTEKYRSTILDPENRNSFFDIQQNIYDLAIEFAYFDLNDSRKAFQYSEDSRARSLLDSITGNTSVKEATPSPDMSFEAVTHPLRLDEIQTRMPVNAQIVQYAVLSDKVVIWCVTRNTFSTAEKSIPQRDLENLVGDYIRLITDRGDANESRDKAKQLYDVLISPIEDLLDRQKTVFLIPDKFLNSLPFSTLVSPASNKFLIENYLLESSPSSSLLVILSAISANRADTHSERLLSVGNPQFDRDKFPSLADLPSASREASAVAECYSSPRLLTGADATRQQITSAMPKSDIVHLAVHSVANELYPIHSKLVLAKDLASTADQSSDGSLEAGEIYRLSLPQTRLVVLSACHSGAERYYQGEGMISLARPFLAARVPLVLASLWSVDSDSTADLMISFHKHRKQENVSSAEALRRAELDMISRPDQRCHEVSCWGAFVLNGGVTTF